MPYLKDREVAADAALNFIERTFLKSSRTSFLFGFSLIILIAGWGFSNVISFDFHRPFAEGFGVGVIVCAVIVSLLIANGIGMLWFTDKTCEYDWRILLLIVPLLSTLFFIPMLGGILSLNAMLDRQASQRIESKVHAVFPGTFKNKSFFIVIDEPWFEKNRSLKISIPRVLAPQRSIDSGDEVALTVGQGAFGIKWLKAVEVRRKQSGGCR